MCTMESSQGSGDDWSIACLGPNEELEPSADELDRMYQRLEAGELLELNWKCPGRRMPTPLGATDIEIIENTTSNASSKSLEFDFMDDIATPTMRVRAQNTTPKSSAKKKTANFANVIEKLNKNKRTNNVPPISSAKE